MENVLLEKYSAMLDEFAWYNKGSVFELAKLADLLGRDYMSDLVARKQMLMR